MCEKYVLENVTDFSYIFHPPNIEKKSHPVF